MMLYNLHHRSRAAELRARSQRRIEADACSAAGSMAEARTIYQQHFQGTSAELNPLPRHYDSRQFRDTFALARCAMACRV